MSFRASNLRLGGDSFCTGDSPVAMRYPTGVARLGMGRGRVPHLHAPTTATSHHPAISSTEKEGPAIARPALEATSADPLPRWSRSTVDSRPGNPAEFLVATGFPGSLCIVQPLIALVNGNSATPTALPLIKPSLFTKRCQTAL